MSDKIVIDMKDGKEVTNLLELRRNFDINKAIEHFQSGKLLKWLNDRFYEDEAEQLEELSEFDENFAQKLGAIFDVEVENIPSMEESLTSEEKELLERVKERTSSPKIRKKFRQVAFNQEELGERLNSGYDEIYLCGGSHYRIPLKVNNKTYIGVDEGGVTVQVKSNTSVDFESLNIHFENIKIENDNKEKDRVIERNITDFVPSSNYQKLSNSKEAEEFFQFGKSADESGDYNKAEEYYKKAVALNHVEAIDHLLKLYFDKKVVLENDEQILDYIQLAVDLGDIGAVVTLANMYREGLGVEENKEKAFNLYQKAAAAGNADAMCSIGTMYFKGEGVEQNCQEAISWYHKSANAGDSMALYNIGYIYLMGDGISKNTYEAVEYFKKSAKMGNPVAMNELGNYYQYEVEDYQKARSWYKKSIDLKFSESMVELAQLYRYGKGVSEDKHKAFDLCQQAADSGNADAMNHLGLMYLKGEGTQQIVYKGVNWLEKAAELGNTLAMKNLGYIYRFGKEVEENKETAFKWYVKAAEKYDPEAMNIVGYMCDNGEGTYQNSQKAMEWYEKAADADNTTAMCNLSYMYEIGESVPKNIPKAIKWLKEAISLGDIEAKVQLGNLYRNTENYDSAMRLYKEVANEGNAEAMNLIGVLYSGGKGVPKDRDIAFKWYKKAAEAGDYYGMANLGQAYLFASKIKNLEQAYYWLSKSAEAGNELGMENFGTYYEMQQKSNEAIYWYKKAAEKGSGYSCERLCIIYRDVYRDKRQSEFWKYEAEKLGYFVDDDNGGKVGCFITTAVCDSFGKPDDCYELTTFRRFRDEWLINQPDGKSLIAEYYEIAPKIVNKINQLTNSTEIYELIWKNYLKPCLSFIEENKFSDCKSQYIKMVKILRKKYISSNSSRGMAN